MMRLSSIARISPIRIWQLFRDRLLEDGPTAGVGAAVVLALNLLSLLFFKRATFNAGSGQAWGAAIGLGGYLLAASAFKRMHDGKAGTEWILLPAEPVEKYLAALLEYALALPLLLGAAATGLSALLALAERASGGPGSFAWTPAAAGGLGAWGRYAVGVCLFLAGSASFRKNAFLKTVGLIAAFGLAAMLVAGGGAWLLGRGSGHLSFGAANGTISIDGESLSEAARRAIELLFELSAYVLAPAFSILFGWAKVAEKEARDEVQ